MKPDQYLFLLLLFCFSSKKRKSGGERLVKVCINVKFCSMQRDDAYQ